MKVVMVNCVGIGGLPRCAPSNIVQVGSSPLYFRPHCNCCRHTQSRDHDTEVVAAAKVEPATPAAQAVPAVLLAVTVLQ